MQYTECQIIKLVLFFVIFQQKKFDNNALRLNYSSPNDSRLVQIFINFHKLKAEIWQKICYLGVPDY